MIVRVTKLYSNRRILSAVSTTTVATGHEDSHKKCGLSVGEIRRRWRAIVMVSDSESDQIIQQQKDFERSEHHNSSNSS